MRIGSLYLFHPMLKTKQNKNKNFLKDDKFSEMHVYYTPPVAQ